MGDCIVLIGIMGAGKSSVGKTLAEMLNFEFIDTDSGIEQTNNMSISDMFKFKGEEYFREKEYEFIHSLNPKNPSIISCGGGSIVDSRNVDYLKKLGKIIYLRVSTDTIQKRTANDKTRPLLSSVDELLKRREQIYSSACDFCIDTDSLSILEVADKIKKLLKY